MRKVTPVLLAVLLATQYHVRAEEDYNLVLSKAHLFYEAQISGKQPKWNRVSLGQGGWRGDSHLADGQTIGKDLSGGFYDAGDFLKASQPLGWVLSNMALGYLEFPKGYSASGNEGVLKNQFWWGINWMERAHLRASNTPADNVFVGQVSNNLVDHKYLGRPEHHTTPRPVYTVSKDTPGADVASQYAAAFASAAVVARYQGFSKGRADGLFKRAKQAFEFAKAYPKNWIIPNNVFQAYKTYWPQGHIGHIAYAAAWLCKYDSSACAEAVTLYRQAAAINNIFYCLGYDYDSVLPGASVLLLGSPDSVVPADVKQLALQHVEGYVLRTWEDTSSRCPKQSYANVCYTPKGLAYYSDWGTLRNTGNMMLIAAVASKYSPSSASAHKCWVRSQMLYITGYSTGRSFVIGYGPNQPQNPHHRGAACPNVAGEKNCKLTGVINAAADTWSNGTCCDGESYYSSSSPCCDYINFSSKRKSAMTLSGAMVGGPDQADVFLDDRMDYQKNEVALDFNLGFTMSAAALAAWQSQGPLESACGVAPHVPVPQPYYKKKSGSNSKSGSKKKPAMESAAAYVAVSATAVNVNTTASPAAAVGKTASNLTARRLTSAKPAPKATAGGASSGAGRHRARVSHRGHRAGALASRG